MPKKKDSTPLTLKPYIFHGVDLQWRDGDKDATADCPFCDREMKFGVEIKTTKWNCVACSPKKSGKEGNNSMTFLRRLHEISDPEPFRYKSLQEDRKLLHSDTLLHWEVALSSITGDWLIPGYTLKGELGQLYRYTKTEKGMRLLPTPTMGHKIHGLNLYDKKKQSVYLCEGPWDAMALWEVLKETKETEEGLKKTASMDMSLLSEANVLAVPGANTFFESWSKWFAEKDVFICFDNDHVRERDGKTIPSAGLEGSRRVAGILSKYSTPPNSISYIHWGEGGINTEIPHGTDVRDLLTII